MIHPVSLLSLAIMVWTVERLLYLLPLLIRCTMQSTFIALNIEPDDDTDDEIDDTKEIQVHINHD